MLGCFKLSVFRVTTAIVAQQEKSPQPRAHNEPGTLRHQARSRRASRGSGVEDQLVLEENDIVACVLAIEYQATYDEGRSADSNFNDANLRTDDEMRHTTGVGDLVEAVNGALGHEYFRANRERVPGNRQRLTLGFRRQRVTLGFRTASKAAASQQVRYMV